MLLNYGVGEDFESLLDCKEIQPVHPKGNQSWIFNGRIGAAAPILGHLMQRTNSLEKMVMLGKIEGRKRRGQQRWDSWIINKGECWRIDAFELWCWRRLLRVPWTARRSNQSILKEISPEYSLERLMPDILPSTGSLSHVWLFVTPAHQASLSITNSWSLLKIMSIELVMPSNHLILCRPLLLLPSIFPIQDLFPMSQLFTSGGQNIGVSASVSVLPMNTQGWSPLGWTGWISLSLRDSQESSPTPQFESINSLVLSFLYSPTLTSTHDYWKNHSFD